MKLSLNHLKRYSQIASMLWKYGRSDLVQHMGMEEGYNPEAEGQKPGDATPDQLADDLQAMSPTYIKIGQVPAGRPDLMPAPYMKWHWSGYRIKSRPFRMKRWSRSS